MKKIITLLFAIVTITLSAFSQSPEGFKYQAVVRGAEGLVLNNQEVGIRLTIQQSSIGGTAVYTETFMQTTNTYGLVNLEVGSGTSTDDFAKIDWANGPFFIETAIDVEGGTNYVIMGTSQLMSVPYALYAKTSGNGQGPQGPIGETGPAGSDGAVGPQGPQGPDGTPSFVYDISDPVSDLPQYDGDVYADILLLSAPTDGVYWVSLYTETYTFTNMTDPVNSLCAIFKNGSIVGQYTQNIHQHDIGVAMTLKAGDIVELKCASNVGGGVALNSHGYLQKIQ